MSFNLQLQKDKLVIERIKATRKHLDREVLKEINIERELASKCYNAVLDVARKETQRYGASGEAVSLVLRCKKIEGPNAYMGIVHDKNMEVYVNLKHGKIPVTLVEVIGGMTHPRLPFIRNVDIRDYGESELIVDQSGVMVGKDYTMLFRYGRTNTVPSERVLIALGNLINRDSSTLTPLVNSLITTPVKQVPAMGKIKLEFAFLGIDYPLAYFQGPPGAGKTHHLVQLARLVNNKTSKRLFIITETNNLVSSICHRLVEIGVPHHVVVSTKGWNLVPRHKLVNDLTSSYLNKTFDADFHDFKESHKLTDKILEFSRIFVMTVNKFLSPKFVIRRLYCDIIAIDESPLIPTTVGLAALAMNPEVLLLYGDHLQGQPYKNEFKLRALGYEDKAPEVFHSLITNFKLAHSVYHRYIRFVTRTPAAYNKIFLDFFYLNQVNYLLADYEFINNLVHVVGFLDSGMKHPTDVLKTGKTSLQRTSTLRVVKAYIETNDATDHLFLSAYVQQVILAQGMGIHSNTIRPAQGTEAEFVFWDFVTPVPTFFVDNHAAIVALSRFKRKLIFPASAMLDNGWLRTKFKYDDSQTVSQNYNHFLQCLNNTLKINLVDINGDSKLKFIFFIGLLEYALFHGGHLQYEPLFVQMSKFKGKVRKKLDVEYVPSDEVFDPSSPQLDDIHRLLVSKWLPFADIQSQLRRNGFHVNSKGLECMLDALISDGKVKRAQLKKDCVYTSTKIELGTTQIELDADRFVDEHLDIINSAVEPIVLGFKDPVTPEQLSFNDKLVEVCDEVKLQFQSSTEIYNRLVLKGCEYSPVQVKTLLDDLYTRGVIDRVGNSHAHKYRLVSTV